MSEPRDPQAVARRELHLGLAVLVALALVAYLSTVALSGGPLQGGREVRVALPDSGPILRAGEEVRIGGERAGDVKSVTLDAAARGAVATLHLTRGTLGRDAAARVRLRGLAGAVYLELDPGDTRHPLPSGTTLRARPAVQLTDVVAAFDTRTRAALGTTLRGLGGGLADHGTTLQHALGVAPHAVAGLTPQLQALGHAGQLNGLLGSLEHVADAAAPPAATDLAHTVTAARATVGSLAGHRASLGHAIDAAPALERTAAAVLPQTTALLRTTARAAADLQPAVRALAVSLPSLRRIATRTPQLTALERLGRDALPALHAIAPLIPAVRGPAAGLAATTPAIGDLADYLAPYKTELVQAPAGFDRWGGFPYDVGQGAGHRAVRFSMVFTCAKARDPYPKPGAAHLDRKACS